MVCVLQLRRDDSVLGDQEGCGWEEECWRGVDGEVAYLDDDKLGDLAKEGCVCDVGIDNSGADLKVNAEQTESECRIQNDAGINLKSVQFY